MIINAAKRDTNANTELRLSFNWKFIDDITVTTITNIQDRWIIVAFNKYVDDVVQIQVCGCEKGDTYIHVKPVYLSWRGLRRIDDIQNSPQH